MPKVLQDIWIMTNDGIVLFSRVFDKQLDEQLFGALLSALNSFAKEITTEGLSNFELSKKRYILMKSNDIFFIGNSDNSIKEKKLIEAIKKITERFFEKFPPHFFNHWDCDISVFEGFEKEIDEALQDPIKGFWKGF